MLSGRYLADYRAAWRSTRTIRILRHCSMDRGKLGCHHGEFIMSSTLCTSSRNGSNRQRQDTLQWRKGGAANAGGEGNILRICVVGSGPAGFYVTKYLLKARCNVSAVVLSPGVNITAEGGDTKYWNIPGPRRAVERYVDVLAHVSSSDQVTVGVANWKQL